MEPNTDIAMTFQLSPDHREWFKDQLSNLSTKLILTYGAAVETDEGLRFLEIEKNQLDVILQFLFPPTESAISGKLQEYLCSDTPEQKMLDEIYRLLAGRINDWIVCDSSIFSKNLLLTAMAQTFKDIDENDHLPASIEMLKSKKPAPKKQIINRIKNLYDLQSSNYGIKKDKIGSHDGITPGVALLIIVFSWISKLSNVKTDAWELFDDLFTAAVSMLTNEFSRIAAAAQRDINQPKTQGKINMLQQKTDYVGVARNERNLESASLRTNDNSNARTLTPED